MTRRFPTRILAAVVGTALGCAESPCPEEFLAAARDRGVELSCEVLRDPGRLVEQAAAAYRVRDFPTAYQDLALVHTLHPGSSQDREFFPQAARLFTRIYKRARRQPDSRWVTTEPAFMFGWLETFFEGAEEFPKEQVEALFVNLPGTMYPEFLAYAKTRPALAGWEIVMRDDNGLIDVVEGRRVEARTGSLE